MRFCRDESAEVRCPPPPPPCLGWRRHSEIYHSEVAERNSSFHRAFVKSRAKQISVENVDFNLFVSDGQRKGKFEMLLKRTWRV
jgi:hypothetical protein